MREKIIDIITAYADFLPWETIDAMADSIIAEGFTRQEWISVKDGLPELERTVLVIDRVTGEITTAHLNDFNSFVFRDGRGHGASYWMPLPTVPEEV